jgi:hypothetical protein
LYLYLITIDEPQLPYLGQPMEDQMKPQEEVVEGKIYFVNNVINR